MGSSFLKESHMSAKKNDSTTSQIDDLFGPPPLIRGEDLARYERLRDAIEHETKPITLFDKIAAREFADKLLQQQRCKQNAASLVEGAYIEALASLLRPFIKPAFMSIEQEDAAFAMARDYYSGNAGRKDLDELEDQFSRYGITNEQIRAKAMQLCGSGVLLFNRMETNCETSLRQLKKEYGRRLAAENAKKPGSEDPDA
jgi:hypothetical protein